MIKNISPTKENISKYFIDYHLKNENLLSNSLINKRLSKHSSYRKIINQSFKASSKKIQYIKKFFDLNSIISINEELRKSGSLLGTNRKRTKRKSRLEHSRELYRKNY